MGYDLSNISINLNMKLLRNLGLLIIGLYMLSLFFRDNIINKPFREGLSEKKEEEIIKNIEYKIKKSESDISGLQKITDLDNFESDIITLLENRKKIITYEAFNKMCKTGDYESCIKAGLNCKAIDQYLNELKEL